MTSTPPTGVHGELKRLTSLRAVAALIVFAYHLDHHTRWLPFDDLADHGYVGVAFFFVLSGFVLTWSTREGTTVHDFWVRRVARVYPSHLVTALVALVVPVTAFAITPGAIAANLLLVQGWFPQWHIAFGLNAVSWSLSCEAFFYLCAPFLIAWSRRRSTRTAALAMLGWALAMSAVAVAAGLHSPGADIAAYTNPLIRSGEFALGVLLALLVQRGWRPRVGPLVAGVLTIGLGLLLAGRTLPQSVVDVAFVPAFAALVLTSAVADIRGARTPLHHRSMTYAGEVSFAFYLVHELVIMNLAAVVGPGGTLRWGLVWSVLALVLATAGAVALHHGVERPAQRAIRRRFIRRSAAPDDRSVPGSTPGSRAGAVTEG